MTDPTVTTPTETLTATPTLPPSRRLADPADYNEANIKVLEGVEHVRKRPNMYVGDQGARGLHHLINEIVDNSIDEAGAGYCTSILVKLNADGGVTVADDGRGIPVGIHPTEGVPTVEVVFSKLGAGGKFENDEGGAYKVSGGLHGVGASVVNALSEFLEVEVSREGKVYHMGFERGHKTVDLKQVGDRESKKNGTKVTFKPDAQIFSVTEFVYDTVAKRMRELAFLNEGLHIVLEDERTRAEGGGIRREEFQYDDGIVEFVKYVNDGKNAVTPVIHIKHDDAVSGLSLELALQYVDTYSESITGYVNNINTHEGGTHISGFKSSLTGTINRYAKAQNLVKNVTPNGDDVREGLTVVMSLKVPDPQFEGQTKTKLGNGEVEGFVAQVINEQLGRHFEENPKHAKMIFEKSVMAAEAREAARKARDLKRKSVFEGNSLPGKLSDCRSKSNETTELFLVEGDSAGGSAKQGRDSNLQAILALRGKLLNVEKATLVKMLGHEEIRTIIGAIGAGIRDDFDVDKRRYGKIVIMTDADVDGSHIRTLLLTFFFRHMGELIKSGRVYVAQPPLYQVKQRRKVEYVLNDSRMRQITENLGLDGTALLVRETDADGEPILPMEGEADGGRRIDGDALRHVVDALAKVEEASKIIGRRGIDFADFLAKRRELNGTIELPKYLATVDGAEHFFFTEAERDAYLAEHRPVVEDAVMQEVDANSTDPEAEPTGAATRAERLEKNQELHEVKDLERALTALEAAGLAVEDYFLTQEQSVSGELMATKYALVQEGKTREVAGVGHLLSSVHALGKQGVEIKRFKGLGEMNAEELWETTLDPSKRMLLRVTLEEAGEAERLFSVLMGEDVERRRQYIEDHALEVKNLDV